MAVPFAMLELPLARRTAERMSIKIAVPTKSLESYFRIIYRAKMEAKVTSVRISERKTAEAVPRAIKAYGVSSSKW